MGRDGEAGAPELRPCQNPAEHQSQAERDGAALGKLDIMQTDAI